MSDREDLSFSDIAADDAFLDALSRGEDPSDGKDPLAALLLDLREDTEAPMPAAPLLAEVSSLDGARRRQPGAWRRHLASGLVGAAAATLVIAGSGAALYRAEPGSPLWGLASMVFDDRAAVVELSSTLDDMDEAVDGGKSPDELRALLDRARERLRAQDAEVSATPASSSSRPTASAEPSTEAPAVPAPETVTLTETITVTAVPTPEPSATLDPTGEPESPAAPMTPADPAPEADAGAPQSSTPAPAGVPQP